MNAAKALSCRAKITLFTRANCSLCETAKVVLSNVGKQRQLEYKEINVMSEGQKKFRDLYEYDTPVVGRNVLTSCLQITNSLAPDPC